MIVMAAVFISAKLSSAKNQYLISIDIYAFISILFIMGIILGTVKNPNEYTVTFLAMILTLPLLFTDRPIKMICCICLYEIAFIITASNIKTERVLETDVIDCFIFSAISAIVSTYMMGVKCQRLMFEKKAVMLSRIDLLTGLLNRNAYEQSIEEYPSMCASSISCIYVDVNGLHEMNNNHGHAAGDKMLRFVAENLRDKFGINNTYRIGGDEFVAFAADRDENDIRTMVNDAVCSIEKESYHVSVGVEFQESSAIDMDMLIKNAENRIYEDKRCFYSQCGIDRRQRG